VVSEQWSVVRKAGTGEAVIREHWLERHGARERAWRMIGARIPVMACVRIAAVVIALLLSVELSPVELSAKPAPHGSVTILVTDRSGGVVPGARIEIDRSSSVLGSILKTDSQGRAVLDLPQGGHVLSITCQGSCNGPDKSTCRAA
jgi:hypothetical protein